MMIESLNQIETTRSAEDFENIGQSIWGRHSVFFYEKETAVSKLVHEIESANSERPPEFLKHMWDKKWDSMDFSWFQMHRQLGP
jgi:hypothetical protein